MPKAYPIYDMDYGERIETIKGWLDGIANLQQVGRNGLHRYNNSDHSMLTAMRAVDNLVKGTEHDIWAVNAESVYHEEEPRTSSSPTSSRPRPKRRSSRCTTRIAPASGQSWPDRSRLRLLCRCWS